MPSEKILHKWNFKVSNEDVPERSGEDPSFDHFPSALKNRYIVREYIQNSLDAPSETSIEPVEVQISQTYIDRGEYSNFFDELETHIRACKESCDQNENSQNPYDVKVEYLENHKSGLIPMTLVYDRNTTGMPWKVGEQSSFKAGVRLMAASYKPGNGKQGGSHGLGKTIGYVASSINTTYTSTMTEPTVFQPSESFGEGVTRLSVHSLLDQETGIRSEYHADAFFDSHEGKAPDSGDEIPIIFSRKEPGTSVYIIGNTLTEKDIKQMKEEVLRSFCLAIKDNDLSVVIAGEHFTQENLLEKMNQYFPENENKFDKKSNYEIVERFNPRPYFIECMTSHTIDENHFFFEATADNYPTIGHATLSIFKSEELSNHHEDRVLCMRDKKMAIEMRSQGSKKGYIGVFVCDGEGSKILRLMENVTHDKWTTKEVKNLTSEKKEQARNILKEIDKFINDCVTLIFPVDDSTRFKVPVLSQLIAAKGNRRTTDNQKSTTINESTQEFGSTAVSTIANGFTEKRVEFQQRGKIVINRKGGNKKRARQQSAEGYNTESTIPIPVLSPSPDVKTDDPKPGPLPPSILPSDPPNPDPNIIPHEPTPEPPQIIQPMEKTETEERPVDSTKPKTKRRRNGNHAEIIVPEPRVIPITDDYGIIHRIIINSEEDYKSCSMVISIAGEDRDTALKFSSVNPNYHISGKDLNVISDFDLHKGKNYIDIRFDDNDIHSLIIKAYEN